MPAENSTVQAIWSLYYLYTLKKKKVSLASHPKEDVSDHVTSFYLCATVSAEGMNTMVYYTEIGLSPEVVTH